MSYQFSSDNMTLFLQRLLLYLVMAYTFASCASGRLYLNSPVNPIQPETTGTPDYTIYALGDGGEVNAQSKAVMDFAAKVSLDDRHPGTIIFLGDNVYPAGFPPLGDKAAIEHAQNILKSQYEGLTGYNGQIIFIPGNHDWNEFHPGGRISIIRQGEYLNQLEGDKIRMLPVNGCGGPVTLQLNEKLTMVIIDSQWWIQSWDNEPDMNAGCEIQSREDFIKAFHKTIDENNDKQIIVAMHHPMHTQGAHGGHFTLRDHLFPLSKKVKWLYLPLPVIGSIYPLYRNLFGHPQDIQHAGYSKLKNDILKDLEDNGSIIFIAGHDHNLQYIVKDDDHFILSGSISKQNPIANSQDLIYGHKAAGFAQLDYYKDQGIRLTIYEVDPASGSSKQVFSRFIMEKAGS